MSPCSEARPSCSKSLALLHCYCWSDSNFFDFGLKYGPNISNGHLMTPYGLSWPQYGPNMAPLGPFINFKMSQVCPYITNITL